jgi:hypothetical protein
MWIMRNGTPSFGFARAVLLLSLLGPGAALGRQYQPTVGQAGKDVIWVPTPETLIAAMLDVAKVTPIDFVMDLGSGDGRIVIAAAKRGARALGVEFNPDMVAVSKANAQKAGVAARANFVQADIFATDFSQATVITMYLLPGLNMKLRPKILDMKPGTRVVSHAFDMEDWDPDQTVSAGDRTAYFWIVPARAQGTWTWPKAELTISQKFQKIEGSLKLDSQALPLKNAKLEGDKISFAVGDSPLGMREYAGRFNGNQILGTVKIPNGPEVKWTATLRPAR